MTTGNLSHPPPPPGRGRTQYASLASTSCLAILGLQGIPSIHLLLIVCTDARKIGKQQS